MVNNISYVKKNGEHDGHDVSVSGNIRWFLLRACCKVLFILLPGQLPRSRGCVHLGGSEPRKIRYFLAFENNLSGPLPTKLGFLTSLRDLGLFSNYLTGTLPTEVGNLNQLETLFKIIP